MFAFKKPVATAAPPAGQAEPPAPQVLVANPLSAAKTAVPAPPPGVKPAIVIGARGPALDEVKLPEGTLLDASSFPPGAGLDRPNVATFTIDDRKLGLIPIGRNEVTISDTDLQFYRLEAPCNIVCCAGRVGENVHWSSIKLLRHSRGARSAAALLRIVIIAVLAAVGVIYGMDKQKNTQEQREQYGIAAAIVVFIPLFVMWFLDRKAFFAYSTTSTEGSPIAAFIAPEGIKVSQWKIEQAIQAAWAAWARFRAFKPSGGPFDPLKAASHPQAAPKTDFTHRSFTGAPAGGDYMSIVDNAAVLLQRTRGFCNLDLFTSSVWESFWADDVQYLHYSLGGRTRRGFFGAIAVAAGVALGIAFGRFDAKERDKGDATGPSAAAGGIVLVILLIRWFLSAHTHIQFGLTDAEQPAIRVPQLSSDKDYDAVTRTMFRRDVDKEHIVTPGGSRINGKDASGNQVELTVTPDITEIRIFQGATSGLEKLICRLCTDQSVYRCRTKDLLFVYASTASIVNAMVTAFSIAIVGIVVTVLLVPELYKSKSQDYRDEQSQQGIGVSLGVAILIILYTWCTRKSVVVLGTPLAKPMTPWARAMDALGFLPPEAKYMFRVEFVSLFYSPEETLKLISDTLRAAKAKSHPLDTTPLPFVTGLPGLPPNPTVFPTSASGATGNDKGAGAFYPTPGPAAGMGVGVGMGMGMPAAGGYVPSPGPAVLSAATAFSGGVSGMSSQSAGMGIGGGMGMGVGGGGYGGVTTSSTAHDGALVINLQVSPAAAVAVSAPAPAPAKAVPAPAKAAPPAGEDKKAAAEKAAKAAARADFDAGELPPGWTWEQTDDGEVYYVNPDGETTWDDPREDWDTFWREYTKTGGVGAPLASV